MLYPEVIATSASSTITNNMLTFGYKRLCKMDPALKIGGEPLADYFNHPAEDYKLPSETTFVTSLPATLAAMQKAVIVALGRRLIVTSNGFFGLAPATVNQGDIICMLFGCSVLVILRPDKVDRRVSNGRLRLVGECYVHGRMEGATLERLEQFPDWPEDFTIY